MLVKAAKKLAQRLDELLPAKSRVFFIYTHRNGFDRFCNGLKANTEISYWCYTALKEHFPRVSFLRLEKEKRARIDKISPHDVVIGHVGETFTQAARRTKKLITFQPWAGIEERCKEGFNCAPKEVELGFFDQASTAILLTSEYNKREYFDQPRNFWYPYFQTFQTKKRVRLVHQPIDLTRFPRVKWEYKTDDFLYIGNDAYMKCVGDSKRLVEAVGRSLHLYGITRKIDHLNSSQVALLPKSADFFIQPGMWEAQCVSILESAARGFIPIVSPETGYPYEHPYLLRYGDFEYNLNVLKKLLRTSAEERKELADFLHRQLVEDEHHNTWKKLTDVLVEEVARLL